MTNVDSMIESKRKSLQEWRESLVVRAANLAAVQDTLRRVEPVLQAYDSDLGTVYIDFEGNDDLYLGVILGVRESGLGRELAQRFGMHFEKRKDEVFGGTELRGTLDGLTISIRGYVGPGCTLTMVKRNVELTAYEMHCVGEEA